MIAVHPDALENHLALGWKRVEEVETESKQETEESKAAAKKAAAKKAAEK